MFVLVHLQLIKVLLLMIVKSSSYSLKFVLQDIIYNIQTKSKKVRYRNNRWLIIKPLHQISFGFYFLLFNLLDISKVSFIFAFPRTGKGSDGRVARLRSAKPPTAVRIRFRPRFNNKKTLNNGSYTFKKKR